VSSMPKSQAICSPIVADRTMKSEIDSAVNFLSNILRSAGPVTGESVSLDISTVLPVAVLFSALSLCFRTLLT